MTGERTFYEKRGRRHVPVAVGDVAVIPEGDWRDATCETCDFRRGDECFEGPSINEEGDRAPVRYGWLPYSFYQACRRYQERPQRWGERK